MCLSIRPVKDPLCNYEGSDHQSGERWKRPRLPLNEVDMTGLNVPNISHVTYLLV